MKSIQELFSFDGKVIIITGAAGAIGSTAGHLFASLGANVVISDLNEEGAKKVAAEIEKESGKGMWLRVTLKEGHKRQIREMGANGRLLPRNRIQLHRCGG